VDLAGSIEVLRQSFVPARAPISAEGSTHFFAQPLLEGRDRFSDAIIKLQRTDMFIEVLRTAGAAPQRVDFTAGKAVKVVKLHRRERGAQVTKLWRRLIEFSTLIIRTDDKDTHVPSAGRHDCRPIKIIDEVPVNVQVIEVGTLDSLENNVGRRVGRKAHKAG